jgi:hypothetical protein
MAVTFNFAESCSVAFVPLLSLTMMRCGNNRALRRRPQRNPMTRQPQPRYCFFPSFFLLSPCHFLSSLRSSFAQNYFFPSFISFFLSFSLFSFFIYSLSPFMHYATNRKVAGSNPNEVIEFLNFSRTMTLGSTQSLTEMSTRNLLGGQKAAGA